MTAAACAGESTFGNHNGTGLGFRAKVGPSECRFARCPGTCFLWRVFTHFLKSLQLKGACFDAGARKHKTYRLDV